MISVHLDMETADPDDVMALCVLATHPEAVLAGVTVHPGTREQVGLVRHVLRSLDRGDVPIGASDPDRPKSCVSGFHRSWFPSFSPDDPDGTAEDVLSRVLYSCPWLTLVTGAALTNPWKVISSGRSVSRWVAQGGFAGDPVVPEEHRLPKFAGLTTCPTFNFNGNPAAALGMLSDPGIPSKVLVSKNVCHGVVWDRAFHERVLGLPRLTPGLSAVVRGMGLYLGKHGRGKAQHDVLAAVTAIDESVCRLVPVRVFRERGEWGSVPSDEPGCPRISVSYDPEAFFRVLTDA